MRWHQPTATDQLFITLRKSEALSSPTTGASVTGQLYLHHAARRSQVLLLMHVAAGFCAAVQRWQGTVTEPFVCLGFATYESHEGERTALAEEWRSAGGWSGRFWRRGCTAVVCHSSCSSPSLVLAV